MATMTKEISNRDDVIDARDVIKRIEELEDLYLDGVIEDLDDDDRAELGTLSALMEDMKGYGGDEQWRGDWYPITLVHEFYFKQYAEELAESIGAIDSDAGWPSTYIDWEAAAAGLQMDYTSVEYDGVTYWYR